MDDSISRFWDKYIVKTKTYKVKDESVRWYVLRAEHYIAAHKGLRLVRHTADDVKAFLSAIPGKENLLDWQYRQVVHALKILFCDVVTAEWALTFPWDDWELESSKLPKERPFTSTLSNHY